MKKAILYLFTIVFILALGSCAKDGGDGPMGAEGRPGAKGEQGIEGKQGIPGTDGKMIHHGDNPPTVSIGAEGDFYIDKKNSNLYGPKTSTGWGVGSSMKGADGQDGKDGAKGDKGDTGAAGKDGAKGDKGDTGAAGSQFLSGTTDPTNAIGKAGDFYFNRTSGTLFGPKTTVWTAGVNLKGPKGDKGDKGDTGNANVYSSGWIKLPINNWLSGSRNYESPLDIKRPIYSNSAFPIGSVDGVVLVYVRSLRVATRITDIMLLPVMDKVTGGGKTGGIELRFAHSGDSRYALWADINVGLQTGDWDENYMKNTYLPSLEWKVVQIPPMLAKAHERGLSKIDMNNYQEVANYFNLED